MSENLGNFAGNKASAPQETRKKRKAMGGISGQQNTKRGRIIDLDEVRTLEIEIVDDGFGGTKKGSKLFLHVSSWKEVFVFKVDDLKLTELHLDRNYEGVWQNRDRFCLRSDDFIIEFEKFASAPEVANNEESQKNIRKIESYMVVLGKKQAEKEAIVDALGKSLEMFEKERSNLSDGDDSPESKRLEEWIIGTCLQFEKVESEIAEKEELITETNENLMKITGNKNSLFSFVSLEDVKRLTPFKTTRKSPFFQSLASENSEN